MQHDEIKQSLVQVERYVDSAAHSCASAHYAPSILRQCLNRLDQETEQAKRLVESSQDVYAIRECIDRMDELGDQAVSTSRVERELDPQLRTSVEQAQEAIAILKYRLH